jgi:hypothetical protein
MNRKKLPPDIGGRLLGMRLGFGFTKRSVMLRLHVSGSGDSCHMTVETGTPSDLTLQFMKGPGRHGSDSREHTVWWDSPDAEQYEGYLIEEHLKALGLAPDQLCDRYLRSTFVANLVAA